MTQVRISDIVAKPHLEYFNSMKAHQIDYGGRNGYKSSKNAIKIALKMISDQEAECVVVRQDKVDHRKSTFRDLISAFNERLHYPLEEGINYPTGSTGSLWIKLPKGNMVHFEQMKSIDKLKGVRPTPSKKIKIVWYFEITEYKSAWYIAEANSGLDRGKKDYMIHLYEFNPAPKLSHWTYDWLEQMRQRPDTYIKKTNYNDAPIEQQKEFLGEPTINEIEMMKLYNPEMFKSVYLGYPANLSGTVYKQFDLSKHIQEPTYNYEDITIGVDFGGADATVFSALGWVKQFKGLEMFGEYYHKNGESNHVKNINDYVIDFLEYAKSIHEWWGKAISVFIDPANLTFKQLIEEKSYDPEYNFIIVEKFQKRSDDKGKSSVQERVDLTEIMWGSNYLKVSPKCKHFIKAVQEAEYNDNNERADDGRSNIDSLDAFEYSWLKEKKLIKQIILG